MCRLFGFRSIIQSHVHSSLTRAENALGVQAERHRDGWGVAYYVSGIPHVVKSPTPANEDRLFQRVSGVVSSELVIAHVRKATCGELSILNCHPFQHGRWVFAHNGTCYGFDGFRERLIGEIRPSLRAHLRGQTDSEVLFLLLLSQLDADALQSDAPLGFDALAAASREATERIWKERPERHPARCHDTDPTCLSFLLTDGEVLLAHQGGRPLCFAADLEAAEEPTCGAALRRLRVASEPLSCSEAWTHLEPFGMVGAEPAKVGAALRLRRVSGIAHLPTL